MPKIKIYRKRDWTSRIDQTEIYLDGQKIGKTRYGETKEIDVTAGSHRLQVKLNSIWGGSKELQITTFSKDIRTFCVERNKVISYIFLILLLGLVFLKRYFIHAIVALVIITHTKGTVAFSEVVYNSVICSALYVMVIVCFLFIGRTSYFKIKEEGAD
jgi:hypothetical protein